MAGRNRQLYETPHLLDLFLLNEAGWIEMLDFAGDLAVEGRGIERLDARDAIAAGNERLPCFFCSVANRGQQTDTGDYNSAGNSDSPSARRESSVP
jgi:hypothetical protein